MTLRLFPLVLFGALALGVTAPQLAQAAPIDLGSNEDEDEDDFDLDLDLDLKRGGPRMLDTEETTDEPDDFLMDEEFDEPIEDFEGIPEEGYPEDLDPSLPDFEDPDGVPLGDFDRPRRGNTRGPGPITIDVAGKQPLADNYPIEVVAVDRDAVVVELPVLLARSRVEVEAGFLVYAEVYVGKDRVTEVRQVVERSSVAEFGPSFAFLKLLAPVVERQGQIKVKVFKADLDGGNRAELFSRVTPYALQ